MTTNLLQLKKNAQATIISLMGGRYFQTKLRTMGIREGKMVKLVATHPFGGPVVIEVSGRKTTIGRKMAERIIVEA